MSPLRTPILIVDDELHLRQSLACWFREDGYEVLVASGAKEALAILADKQPKVLLVDIKMPGIDGLELQQRVRQVAPDAAVIIMTAYASVDTAVQALKEGAYDYIIKPFDPEDVSRLVRKAAERYSLVAENQALRRQIESTTLPLVAGSSRAMLDALRWSSKLHLPIPQY